jgi:uncharacterized protein YbaR (Trm112 family)
VTLSPDLLALLVCPQCKGALAYHTVPREVLLCRAERLVFNVQDGIPILLLDEAMPLDDAEFPARG